MKRSRSYSLSVSESHTDQRNKQTISIVVDHAAPVSKNQDNGTSPLLEVPIPHYRLGTPTFSARGTAFLHSSVLSRDSATEDFSSVSMGQEYEKLFPVPPGMEGRSVFRRHSSNSAQALSSRMASTTDNNDLAGFTSSPAMHRPDAPISPEIFDALASNPDDPAIVRYAPGTKEVIAASTARIIAQITSKSFLDYELLSDFFLTVRAYLSTRDLLAYLMARFVWAINRLDDEGQVIRVRTFAALRHWILNYFPYDFVVDRDLRVDFCQRINEITKILSSRRPAAQSDLKLIFDLKKCWNGRVALYWDSAFPDISTRFELDISPGGIVGSRNSQLTHPSQLWGRNDEAILPQIESTIDQATRVSALNNWFDTVMEAEDKTNAQHGRQMSTATSHSLPLSPLSEQSIQALSCSFPAKCTKTLVAQSNLAAHPVEAPSAPRKACPAAPSATANETGARPNHEHKRSGSFSDALRDRRASLPTMQIEQTHEDVIMAFPYSGSLIRGNVLPPGSPFIDIYDTMPSEPALPGQGIFGENLDNGKLDRPQSPRVKTLLGTIRRVLSSKQPGNPASSYTVGGGSTPYVAVSKNLSLALNFQSEDRPTKRYNLEASKTNARIDLLCAAVAEKFQQAMKQAQQDIRPVSNFGINHEQGWKNPSQETLQPTQDSETQVSNRKRSEVTNGSRSIRIYDDTGSNPPIPSLPSEYESKSKKTTELKDEPRNRQQPEDIEKPSHPESAEISQPRGLSTFSNQRLMKSASGSGSIRKYASFHSGTNRAWNPDPVSMVQGASKPPERMLRRRPGGNLRENQNVHDLELIPRPKSAGSITTYTDSIHGSGLCMTRAAGNAANQVASYVPQGGPLSGIPLSGKSVSLVRTHSSQPALRPSFEAAVAEFARIPDDEGGDIEATILKLEGRYRKLPGEVSPNLPNQVFERRTETAARTQDRGTERTDGANIPILHEPKSAIDVSEGPTPSKEEYLAQRDIMTRSLYAESEESYDSTPLLEREPGERQAKRDDAVSDRSRVSSLQRLSKSNPTRTDHEEVSSISTSEDGEIHSPRNARYRSSIPTTTDSFLLDEDEFLSDLDSLSDGTAEPNEALDEALGHSALTFGSGLLAPNPAFAHSPALPPTPPLTTENLKANESQASQLQDHRKPPTPQPSPEYEFPPGRLNPRNGSTTQVSTASKLVPSTRHIPYVLGTDSKILAEQFTIIEKDALNEINWLDLVNMRWHHTSPSALNWVEFLRTQDPTGIELVTARFNVVVKWALSEIVLTQNIGERALTIIKFVHVAVIARKAHNFATMLQLTIALTSVDCSRLKKTWAMVPEAEKQALQELEDLITPIKNFHNLRQEMETVNSDDGCIPVVALYIHDLTYNSQKPSQIPGPGAGAEPLINFERYRTTASIVKSLLRLIDASAKYTYKPVESVIERCLWMAALSDEMIRLKSKELE